MNGWGASHFEGSMLISAALRIRKSCGWGFGKGERASVAAKSLLRVTARVSSVKRLPF